MNELIGQDWVSALTNRPITPGVRRHPGMLSEPERSFLYHCVVDRYLPGTDIVDAGIFLGASTNAICTALVERGVMEPRVYSYEMALANEKLAQAVNWHLKTNLEADQSFEPHVAEVLAPFVHLLKLNFGDITTANVLPENPCSILFIDVVKNRTISDFVVRTFYPKMISGETIIIHQDYFHPQHVWIQLALGRCGQCFRYVGRPEHGEVINTAVFQAADLSETCFEDVALDFGEDRERDLAAMDTVVDMHSDVLERVMVAGCRAAVQAWYDRDDKKVFGEFLEHAEALGGIDLIQSKEQQHHYKRIRNGVRRFAQHSRSLL